MKHLGVALSTSVKHCLRLYKRNEMLLEEQNKPGKKLGWFQAAIVSISGEAMCVEMVNINEVKAMEMRLRLVLEDVQVVYGPTVGVIEELKPESFMSRVTSKSDLRPKRVFLSF